MCIKSFNLFPHIVIFVSMSIYLTLKIKVYNPCIFCNGFGYIYNCIKHLEIYRDRKKVNMSRMK